MTTEDFQFGQVTLTSKYKQITYRNGLTPETYTYGPTVDLKHKGTIYGSYVIDGIEHKKRVAQYWYARREKMSYITFYDEAGVDVSDVETMLYTVITQALNRDAIIHASSGSGWNHTFAWLIGGILEARRKVITKSNRLLKQKNKTILSDK